jgi:two-component system, LuxR family, response regulator FixJ
MSDQVVHLIDDDEAVRESISFVLDIQDFRVRTYASALEFLNRAELEPGCVVTDIRMPGMSGMDLVRKMKDQAIDLPVVMITGHADVPLAVNAMRAGVVDFLEKPFDNDALIESIRMALAQKEDRSRIDEARDRFTQLLATLSPRETDVLRGVLAGKMNKVIAHDLGISVRTVEVYRANLMSKTNAGGLPELVRIATLAGF